jgi:hypothetical protein
MDIVFPYTLGQLCFFVVLHILKFVFIMCCETNKYMLGL